MKQSPEISSQETSSHRRIRKACLACRTAKRKCDTLQPRCTHCEQRDLVCDYSWKQRPRGPPANPLSGRSARRRRRFERLTLPVARNTRLLNLKRESPESDTPTSSDYLLSIASFATDTFGTEHLPFAVDRGQYLSSDPAVSQAAKRITPPQQTAPLFASNVASNYVSQAEGPLFRFGYAPHGDIVFNEVDPNLVGNDYTGTVDAHDVQTLSHLSNAPERSSNTVAITPAHRLHFSYSISQQFQQFKPSDLSLTPESASLPTWSPIPHNILPQRALTTMVLSTSIPRSITLFDDLPPLPGPDTINDIIRTTFQRVHAGDNLFAFLVLHWPTFFARVRAGTVDPLLLLCVLCLGCRYQPARETLRPIFSKRAARLLKWTSELAKQSGLVSFASLQALTMWTTFVIDDLCRGETGQSWFTFTVALAKAMKLDDEVSDSNVGWIEREERRRVWWWCWCMDAMLGIGSNIHPRLPPSSKVLLPCGESYFSLDPPPLVPPANRPNEVVVADLPIFLNNGGSSVDQKHDHVWLLFVGMAKQARSVLRVKEWGDALERERELQAHIEISKKLLDAFPAAVRILASDTIFPDAPYVYHGWFHGSRDLPRSVPHPLAVMAIMVYFAWSAPLRPKSKNMLVDTSWVASENFLPCMQVVNACTKLIERLLIETPTFPIPGVFVLYGIFHMGVIHLMCVKQALAVAPMNEGSFTLRSSVEVNGKRKVQLSEVLNSIGINTPWTSDRMLNDIVIDSLSKADIHGRALKIHATQTKAGEAIWNLWDAMLKDSIPVLGALGSLAVTERIVEVNRDEYLF
ncbi:hypothetical protein M427DRAFT_52816 [Gonapodya prolifera JEL478]|uniref:Zn(2)-C6 fungal-type domain-containing protein n=1 Tax=Gonapodya prolifera (strain JEL478) TaxID=1344416 RepID=A0A139ARK8_GONPJ|nr:hypothetical protein M427DRAFT_52816 [Gonapodya prolifera JEL478]|eukprot:KXS19378.1 hypothetical protein M427DRAFT_52816 [Gonapodya prolifera JEL478]